MKFFWKKFKETVSEEDDYESYIALDTVVDYKVF